MMFCPQIDTIQSWTGRLEKAPMHPEEAEEDFQGFPPSSPFEEEGTS
jgi:hypothetical protein